MDLPERKEEAAVIRTQRDLFSSRVIFKREAEWLSLATPLWLWGSSFLSTSLSKYIDEKRGVKLSSSHVRSYTQAILQGQGEFFARLWESGQIWYTLHFLHPSPRFPAVFSGNYWLVRQPTLATDSMPWVTGHFSETYSSGNSGLTRAPSEMDWQALQLIKTRKNPKTSYRFQMLLWT